jgi:hypothetical protein
MIPRNTTKTGDAFGHETRSTYDAGEELQPSDRPTQQKNQRAHFFGGDLYKSAGAKRAGDASAERNDEKTSKGFDVGLRRRGDPAYIDHSKPKQYAPGLQRDGSKHVEGIDYYAERSTLKTSKEQAPAQQRGLELKEE